MNEPIAVSRYTLTKALFDEGMRRVSKENYGKFAKKVVIVLLAAWLLIAVATVVLGQGWSLLLGESVVTLLVCLWVTVYLPWDRRRRGWKKLEGQYGEASERTVRFYPDRVNVQTCGREITVAYEDVQTVLRSENLLILLAGDGTGILAKTDSFTEGSAEGVLNALPETVRRG